MRTETRLVGGVWTEIQIWSEPPFERKGKRYRTLRPGENGHMLRNGSLEDNSKVLSDTFIVGYTPDGQEIWVTDLP